MKLFFERNAKYQATRTISTNYQDISIFFSFNSNSILLTEQWKWEEKKTQFFFNYITSISHQKALLFCISPLLSNRDICVIPIAPF